MRLTCPQTRQCQRCGKTIVRFKPTQPWMRDGDFSAVCTNGGHKPAPLPERQPA